MADCIFCRILDGSVPAELVYQATGAVAFLDGFPTARGHTLVVPRLHAPTILDLPDDAVADLFRAVREVTRKLSNALHPVAFNIGWNHGRGAGQAVFHLHVHVLPRYAEGGRGVQSLGSGGDRRQLAETAAILRRG